MKKFLFGVSVEAQAVRKDKTIGAKRNHLNFALSDTSSSINGRMRIYYFYEDLHKNLPTVPHSLDSQRFKNYLDR